MPTISQPFRLASLPKISSLNNYASQANLLQVADTLAPSANYINVGISGSAISQYITNPTPKLVYNLPIPSTNIVKAFDQADSGNNEVLCYALQANKTFSLHCLEKPICKAPVADSNFGDTFASNKLSLAEEPISVKVLGVQKCIVLVLRSGLVQLYDFSLTLQHSFDISYKDVQFVQHFTNESGQSFVFILSDIKGGKVSFKLLEIDQVQSPPVVKELSSVILEDFPIKDSQIFYQFGKIYRLHNSKIDVYTLPYFQHSHTISLPFLSPKSETSFKPISQNRALLTADNKLYLLDLLHQAVLSSRELTHIKTFQLLCTAVVPGNLTANNETLAIGVSTKHGSNPTSALDIVNIDVGTGTLKDSMGRGFSVPVSTHNHLQSVLEDYSAPETKEFNYDQILKELKKAKGSIQKFDTLFFQKLKIKREHYTDSDRFINDREFLQDVTALIFQNFESDYPKALPYLLTHPLFPKPQTQDILLKLKAHPRLFKQAIVTCPNLSLDELLQELFTVMNDELCLDLSLRILQDFTKDTIKDAIKRKSKLEVNNFVNFVMNDSIDEDRIKNKPRLFQLLSLVLDSVGLLSLTDDTLAKICDYINLQLHTVKQNVELFNLLEDTSSRSTVGPNQNDASITNETSIPLYSVEKLEL
ncbi:LADA_0B04544g1_1 [Lachancea dasiensis]|uniref:LADA_0B04544g1_1 n=1 Tax=Lachancea dasiensis TaxID=1072105 RepID=A0A1G4ISU6_9SACH|nr:LADA_0B04544g1_1 [Lachancea dasiensis]